MRATDRSERRGFSMLLVTAVVAVASVLGLAILSSNALQVEASRGQDRALQAEALAESGINLGLYYLQNINDSAKCPATVSAISLLLPTVHTQTDVSVGPQAGGTFDLQIARTGLTRYVVTATGKATAPGGTVSRRIAATVDLNYYAHAAHFNKATETTTLPPGARIVGDVYSAGPLVNNAVQQIAGTVYADTVSGSGSQLASRTPAAISEFTPLPVVSLLNNVLAVNKYLTYAWKDGVAKVSGVLVLLPLSNTTRNPTVLNPAGILTAVGDLDLNGGVTINGTLIVTGNLRIQGTNTINPRPNFPALIVTQDVVFKADNATLNSNGLTFIGGRAAKAGGSIVGSTLNVKGSLINTGGTGALDPAVAFGITYDRAAAAVPSLSTLAGLPVVTKPASLTIASWQNY